MSNKSYTLWGALQKPKEVRERNRRLLRVNECLQQHDCQGVKINGKTFENLCWRSGTIVIADRRIAKITNSTVDGSYKPECNEQWFDNIPRGAAAQMEASAQSIMDYLSL